MKQLTSNSLTLVLVLIMITGVAVRLINITQPLLEFFPQRQTQTAEITRNIYINGWPDFWTPKVRYFTDGQPIPYVLEFPFYNGLVAVAYHLFGPNVILGRLASLTFFTLSSIVFYRLLRMSPNFPPEKSVGASEYRTLDTTTHELKPREQGSVVLGSLLFFVFSPLHILVSRSFQPEELALFLLLLAIWKKSWVAFALAMLVKLPTALFIPVMLSRVMGNKRSIFSGFLSLVPAFFWYARASRLTVHPVIARNFDVSNWFQPQLWFKPNWYFSLFQIEHIWVLTTLGLFLFLVGLSPFIASLRGARTTQQYRFWLVWFASGVAYLTIFNYHAMTHEYYHLFLLPPLSAIAGLGLTLIYSNVSKHWSQYIINALLLVFVTAGLILPAVKKISSAPTTPDESHEITADRYRFIEDF